MRLKFPCIQCGLCCRKSGDVPQLSFLMGSNGYCRYLDGNKCSIYTKRPLICNIEAMYDKYFFNVMTEDEFIRRNLEVCYKLNIEVEDKEAAKTIQSYVKRYE